QLARQRLESGHLEIAELALHHFLRCHGLEPPVSMPSSDIDNGSVVNLLDRHKYAVYSEFIRRAWIQLPELVRLLRGESEQDPRPNKALEEPVGVPNWEGYRYRSRWNQIILNGVTPESKSSFTEQVPAARALDVIIKHLRTGQDSNRYLILAIDLLPQLQGITCSPFGAVQKGEADLSVDARIIHDLSYPPGDSVNDNTVPESEVEVCYDGPDALANRILDVADLYPSLHRMMTGDVNGAFGIYRYQLITLGVSLAHSRSSVYWLLTCAVHSAGKIRLCHIGSPEQLSAICMLVQHQSGPCNRSRLQENLMRRRDVMITLPSSPILVQD
ncbi:hypothetical protein L914_02259, partial [Phytophthora nicotianae]